MVGLKTFGTPEQLERVEQRFAGGRESLLRTPAQDSEDGVARLLVKPCDLEEVDKLLHEAATQRG